MAERVPLLEDWFKSTTLAVVIVKLIKQQVNSRQ
jgi:hypothetical protein